MMNPVNSVVKVLIAKKTQNETPTTLKRQRKAMIGGFVQG